MGRMVQEGGGGSGEKDGIGGSGWLGGGGNRWYATLRGTSAATGGGGGGVGADKWGVGGGTFPQSASRDDEEGDYSCTSVCVCVCLCDCVFAPSCLHACARMCEARAIFRLEFLVE